MSDVNTMIRGLIESIQDIDAFCVFNRTFMPLEKIEKNTYNEFRNMVKSNMPRKLYKYYPNRWATEQGKKEPVNYSLQALMTNTVYLQSPNLFDDVYDSSFYVDFNEFTYLRMRNHCKMFGCDLKKDITLDEMIDEYSKVYDTNKQTKGSDLGLGNSIKRLINENFNILINLAVNQGAQLNDAIRNGLNVEYKNFLDYLQKTFRISCFTTTPFSQLMWGTEYADNHRGFCVEYDMVSDDKFQLLLDSLLPVIYCRKRTNMTERLINIYDNKDMTIEDLMDLYVHGALRKSIDWAFQDEWRLLLPNGYFQSNYTIPFFPISKVFLGNRMDSHDRARIINICHEKSIPYIGIMRSEDKFEMHECMSLCEKCLAYYKK